MKVLVKASLLKWTRENIRIPLNAVASRLGVKDEDINNWETADSEISISHLRALSKIYKRPLGFFFLNTIPESEKLPADFRINYSTNNEEQLSTEIILAIRRAHEIQENKMELPYVEFDNEKIIFKAKLESDPNVLAIKLRNRLRLTLEEQTKWGNPAVAYKAWKDLIEFYLGIIILEFSLPINEVRALSLNDNESPIIIINSKDVPSAKSFSLFHELYHIALGKEGICDLNINTYKLPFQKKQIEIACNQFSAEFLVPKRAFLGYSIRLGILQNKKFTDDELIELAKHFNVSRQVILRRFFDLNYVSETDYFKRIHQWKMEYTNKKAKKGFANPIDTSMKHNSRPYILQVLNAYHENKISLRSVGQLLNTSIKYVSKIENKTKNSYDGRTSFI